MKKSNNEFGLEVRSFPKHKQWKVDQDYAKQLSPEEREWLGKFNQEYYRNRFTKEDNLHDTPELKRACYSNENASNRDLYSIKQVSGLINSQSWLEEDEELEVLDYEMGYAVVDELNNRNISIRK
jgi:hypothetical protein